MYKKLFIGHTFIRKKMWYVSCERILCLQASLVSRLASTCDIICNDMLEMLELHLVFKLWGRNDKRKLCNDYLYIVDEEFLLFHIGICISRDVLIDSLILWLPNSICSFTLSLRLKRCVSIQILKTRDSNVKVQGISCY